MKKKKETVRSTNSFVQMESDNVLMRRLCSENLFIMSDIS